MAVKRRIEPGPCSFIMACCEADLIAQLRDYDVITITATLYLTPNLTQPSSNYGDSALINHHTASR